MEQTTGVAVKAKERPKKTEVGVQMTCRYAHIRLELDMSLAGYNCPPKAINILRLQKLIT